MEQHHSGDLQVAHKSKEENYQSIISQIMALVDKKLHAVSNQANIVAALKEQFGWWWVGFYFVDGDQLYLGPFQGPIACTLIKKGKGVCGASWERNETILVEDVEKFPGHIACSSKSRSEIVVPIKKEGKVIGVLDVDSQYLCHFDQVDQTYLEELMSKLVSEGIL